MIRVLVVAFLVLLFIAMKLTLHIVFESIKDMGRLTPEPNPQSAARATAIDINLLGYFDKANEILPLEDMIE
jgi:hypothetical protein